MELGVGDTLNLFSGPPLTPEVSAPWCSLGALWLANQQRVFPEHPSDAEVPRKSDVKCWQRALGTGLLPASSLLAL